MLCSVILTLFAVTQTIKIFDNTLIDTNLVFYLMVFTVSIALINLTKSTFAYGYCRCPDETKL